MGKKGRKVNKDYYTARGQSPDVIASLAEQEKIRIREEQLRIQQRRNPMEAQSGRLPEDLSHEEVKDLLDDH